MGDRLAAADFYAVVIREFGNTVGNRFKVIDHNQTLTAKPLQQLSLGKLPMAICERDVFDIRGAGHGETDAFGRASETGCFNNFGS